MLRQPAESKLPAVADLTDDGQRGASVVIERKIVAARMLDSKMTFQGFIY